MNRQFTKDKKQMANNNFKKLSGEGKSELLRVPSHVSQNGYH